ncbi:MAG: pantoate--beta-alanine ligase [Anaerolineae bacterium]
MKVIDSIEELRAVRAAIPGKVGLVPTMGALHDGHLALVREACADTDTVVATIFVNPTQFAPGEDLNKYPRDLAGDLEKLELAGVDIVFTPTPEMIYPPGYQTWIDVEGISRGLEGERRPGHFRGVATVVAKLFHLVQPHLAYFGQKDAQQVAVIKQMVRDLNFPLVIIVCPTVREADGLAMSSRNVYLSPDNRSMSSGLYRSLMKSAEAYATGERDGQQLRILVEAELRNIPGAVIEYVSVANAVTFQEIVRADDVPLLISLVVNMGGTRLLDNILLPMELNTREGLTRTLGGT